MKNIKTFEDACKALNRSSQLPDVSQWDEEHRKSAIAYHKLIIIVAALNEGWKPDWNNSNEYKYWPYFDMRNKPGFGFSGANCVRWITDSAVGSRLCFKSRELAEYAGKQFTDIYNDFLNN